MRQLRPDKSESFAEANGSSPETFTFASEFCRLFDAGTRPDHVRTTPRRPWTPKTFCDAIGDAGVSGVVRPHERTINNWRQDVSTPRTRSMMDAVEKVFFGDDQSGTECRRLRELWEAPTTAPKPPRAPRRIDDADTPLEPRSSRRAGKLAWLDMNAEAASQGSAAADFQVVADMRHGVEPFDDIGGIVSIGLSKVTVRYEETGCRPVGERYGDNGSTDGVKSIAGGWEFSAKPGEVLRHRMVEALARFERTGIEQPKVTLRASADTADLRPVLSAETANLPGKVKGILGRYFVKEGAPRKGTIDLGSASVHWVPKR